jgi:hypothetical protein
MRNKHVCTSMYMVCHCTCLYESNLKHFMLVCMYMYIHIMDLIQVGVSVTGSRKTKSSESVPRRARLSPQHQAGPTFSTQVVLGISYVTCSVT